MPTTNEATAVTGGRVIVPGHVTGGTGRRYATTLIGAVLFAAQIVALAVYAPFLGAYLVIISALVLWHEGAHMAVGLRSGLTVSEFAVGFGPVVVSVHAFNTDWSLRAVPAGGFVRFIGASDASTVPDGVPESATLRGTTAPRRVATIAAGPVSNLILAVVLSAAAFGIVGHTTADGVTHRLGPVDAVVAGVEDLTMTATATMSGLGELVGGADRYAAAVIEGDRSDAPEGFMSPVGAADFLGSLDDPAIVVRFAALLSASLGVFNLLPFPPLDGGHLAVEAVNAIRSKLRGARVRVSVRAQNYAAAATLAAFALMSLAALRLDLVAGI